MTNIPPTQELRNFSLTLYGYHLRHTMSQGIEETLPEASLVWEQISKIGQLLQIRELQNIKQQLICYQNDNYQPAAEDRLGVGNYFNLLRGGLEEITFQLSSNTSGLITQGLITPFRVNDTYALDLTLSIENSIEISQLDQLNLKSHLSSPSVILEPSLGQTLLFYAETTISEQYYPELAQNCVSQLISLHSDLELVGTGKILGCSVFIYDNWEFEPSKQKHILLFFNPNATAPEELGEVSRELLLLMCSHHKILYAYNQSRSCQRDCKLIYTYLENKINEFSQIAQSDDRLLTFKQLLTELPQKSLEYSSLLRDLKDHQNTIRTNILNYEKLINKLQQLPDSDITFFQPFLNYADNKLYRQIQADRSFLLPGQKMFQELIGNIRGIVAIDQVESDRKVQAELRTQEEKEQKREKKIESWIAFFGTGLAVSGISSSVVAEPTKTILTNLSKTLPLICLNENLRCYLYYSSLDILFHVLVGLIFAFPMVFLISLIRKKS